MRTTKAAAEIIKRNQTQFCASMDKFSRACRLIDQKITLLEAHQIHEGDRLMDESMSELQSLGLAIPNHMFGLTVVTSEEHFSGDIRL